MIRAERVSVRLGARALVDEVSVAFGRGALAVVAGRNGAGKSTLLDVLSGSRAPSSGVVALDGVPLASLARAELARRRAVLGQRDRLDQPLLVREVVALGRYAYGRADLDGAVERALAAVGATWLADRRMDRLSGGERQRVHLARVLAQLDRPGPPGYLLLDEPTSALDLGAQHDVLGALRRLARSGLGVVCVLHDLNLASCWADRVVLLAGGRIVADGPPSGVITEDHVARALGVRVHVVSHPDHGAARPQLVVSAPAGA